MKKNKGTNKLAILGSGFLACLGLLLHITKQACAVHDVQCIIDERYCSDLQNKIARAVHKKIVTESLSWVQTHAELKQEFPHVEELTIHVYAPHRVRCAIKSIDPLLVINNSLLLSQQGVLVSVTHFAPDVVHPLPMIEADERALQEHHFAPLCCNTLKQLLPLTQEAFTVKWINEYEIWLHDIKSSARIICCAQQLPTPYMLACYQQIKQEYLEQATSKRKKQDCVIDMRFEHQLILKGAQGGVARG